MPPAESALDRLELNRARALLRPAPEPESIWPALGAAALMAISALTLATAMIMAPPVTTTPVAGLADRQP